MQAAIEIVDRNSAKVDGTLRAIGTADGYFTTDDGHRRSFHVDATLFHLAPRCVRLDLKKFGDRQLLFGSNDTDYWLYSKTDEAYYCGRHGAAEELPPDIPLRPDQIGDALGLGLLGGEGFGSGPGELVQRVVDDYQQLLFLIRDAAGRLILEKEYWLDRYPPQLLRRVVFRDADGVVEMESRLDEYRALAADGPLLPRIMIANWPKSHAQLRFRARKWSIHQQVTATSIQFATPSECGTP